MFGRFHKNEPADEPVAEDRGTATAVQDEPEPVADREAATTVQERETPAGTKVVPPEERERFTREEDAATALRERDWEPVRERRMLAPVVGEDTVLAMRARQRSRFGGIRWGSAFFGLLSAIGLASILLGIVAAAGVALNLSEIKDVANGDRDTIGLGGAILLLIVVAVAWYCGGYVAARMARFDGARQGIGVWTWTVVVGAALAIAALIGGNEYDVFQQLNLPNVAVGDASLTTGGIVTLAAALVVSLVCGIVGGIAGDRYHRRVDRFAAREHYELR
ncbi:MAG TPA: hypothetical protein VKB54_21475 [Solirubrobacteraceae bacterium]|nr:hypothetical protein [Solirubrobacteraceae bacterium]